MLLRAVPSITPPKRSPVNGPVVLQTGIYSRLRQGSLFQPNARVVCRRQDVC